MRLLDRQALHDILLGAAIVGTGGGGSLTEGIKLIDLAVDEGLEFMLAEVDEIPGDALIGSPYRCGSIGYLPPDRQQEYDSLPQIGKAPEVAAIEALEKYFGRKFYGVIATELGGGNTASAMNAAARMKKPIIDADPAGRSVPCLQHSTLYLNDVPITPMGLADKFGDCMIIPSVMNDDRAEALARAMAVVSFNTIGVVDHPGEWRILKDALIKNTISYCLNIGRIARAAKEQGRNYAQDVAGRYGGFIMFEGTITEASWEDREGFTYGDIIIQGQKGYKGKELHVWFQNEYIMSWLDGNTYVTVPDSINIVIDKDNMPLINPDAKPGMEVTVFALRAFDEWRTDRAVEIFGPRFFGFDTDYVKVEDILV